MNQAHIFLNSQVYVWSATVCSLRVKGLFWYHVSTNNTDWTPAELKINQNRNRFGSRLKISLWPSLPWWVKGEALQQTQVETYETFGAFFSKCECWQVTHPYSCGILMTDDFISWLLWMLFVSSGRGSLLIGLCRSWVSPCSSNDFAEWTGWMWNKHPTWSVWSVQQHGQDSFTLT